MRVIVTIDGVGELTYEAPDDVKVGTRVMVPLKPRGAAYESSKTGVVTALTSDYTGPCKQVLHVLDEEKEQTHADVG